MSEVQIALYIQVAAVLAAVETAIAALVISALDPRSARRIVGEDWRVSLERT